MLDKSNHLTHHVAEGRGLLAQLTQLLFEPWIREHAVRETQFLGDNADACHQFTERRGCRRRLVVRLAVGVELARMARPRDYMITRRRFEDLQRRWGWCTVDAFASPATAHLPRYWAADGEAGAVFLWVRARKQGIRMTSDQR